MIEQGQVSACHDLSDGGLLVALAEMALAGNVGADLHLASVSDGALLGEDQARYLLVVEDADRVLQDAAAAGVPAVLAGITAGDTLTLNGANPISLSDLRRTHEGWLPAFADGAA